MMPNDDDGDDQREKSRNGSSRVLDLLILENQRTTKEARHPSSSYFIQSCQTETSEKHVPQVGRGDAKKGVTYKATVLDLRFGALQ
jgi:hypothetical protein